MAGFFVMSESFLYRPLKIAADNTINVERPQLHYPSSVTYAGASKRRLIFLRDIFPDIPVRNCDVEPEPKDEDVIPTMRYKIGRARDLVPIDEASIILAADTRTKTPKTNNGRIEMVNQGKPETAADVFNTFKEIDHASRIGIDPPFYTLESGSGMLYRNGRDQLLEMHDVNLITLTREGASRLSNINGFADYVKAFQDFYSRPPYSKRYSQVKPQDLSAGISLPVLVRMGIVDSVNGIPKDSLLFYKALRHAIHIAAVGMSSELLELVGVGHKVAVSHWGWINSVTQSALGKK